MIVLLLAACQGHDPQIIADGLQCASAITTTGANPSYVTWVTTGELGAPLIEAELWPLVRHCAQVQLAGVRHFPGDWNVGNAVHEGNSGLGLAALAHGDEALALSFLERSGHSQGSPTLSTFGPDTRLASRLADAGYHEEVADWLDAVGQYWDPIDACGQRYRLELAASVRAGGSLSEHAFSSADRTSWCSPF